MDRWIQAEYLCSDQDKISKASRKRDKRLKKQLESEVGETDQLDQAQLAFIEGLFENDEHKGMDKRQVQEHEEATKIKTIDYV